MASSLTFTYDDQDVKSPGSFLLKYPPAPYTADRTITITQPGQWPLGSSAERQATRLLLGHQLTSTEDSQIPLLSLNSLTSCFKTGIEEILRINQEEEKGQKLASLVQPAPLMITVLLLPPSSSSQINTWYLRFHTITLPTRKFALTARVTY